MTKECCIPICNSNYGSSLKESGAKYISMFSFPKSEEAKRKWLRAIPRDNWSPSQYSTVCAKHFCDSEIIKVERHFNSDGTYQDVPLKNPKLLESAIPSIFPNLPKYLSFKSRSDCQRTDPQARRENLLKEKT